MHSAPGEVPLWLWRTVRAALFGAVIFAMVGVLVVSDGVADPQRAGSLALENGPLPEIAVPVQSAFALDNPVSFPAPPFTLEITAQLAAKSDPATSWGLQFAS